MKNTQIEDRPDGVHPTHRITWIIIGENVQQIANDVAKQIGGLALLPIPMSLEMCKEEHSIVVDDVQVTADEEWAFALATARLAQALDSHGRSDVKIAGMISPVDWSNSLLVKNLIDLPNLNTPGSEPKPATENLKFIERLRKTIQGQQQQGQDEDEFFDPAA